MILVLLFMAGACSNGEVEVDTAPPETASLDGDGIRLVDDAGRTWSLDAPPRRIISLVPSATGILLELGVEDRLVGRTDYDEQASLASLPSVGQGLNPSMERLVILEPDVVIRFEGPTDRSTPGNLDRLGTPHLAVRPDSIEDIRRIVRLLGVLTGQEERAERLLTEMDEALQAVRDEVAGRDRPRVVFVLGGDPPWVVGSETFLHELLQIAGADNVFQDAGPLYAPMSVEEIIDRDPELVLATEGARIPQALSRLPVRRVPDDVQSPGLEVGRSARAVAEALHAPGDRR